MLTIDAEVLLGVLTLRVVEEIEKLEPYGIGNPGRCSWPARSRSWASPAIVGEQKNHLQLRVKQGDVDLKAIGWNLAERAKALTPDTVCSLVFHPSINEWNNRREVQLEIKDFQLDEASEHGPTATATAPPDSSGPSPNPGRNRARRSCGRSRRRESTTRGCSTP